MVFLISHLLDVCTLVKWAANALEEIGAKAMHAIPSLTEALNHEDMEVREMAAIALQQIT